MVADPTRQDLSDELNFDDFSLPSEGAWARAVVESTRGKAPADLERTSPEGIRIKTMYTAGDVGETAAWPGAPLFRRGTRASGYVASPWLVAQAVAAPTPELADQELREGLAGGLTAANLLLDAPTRAGLDPHHAGSTEIGRDGLSLASCTDLATVLGSVDLTQTPLRVDPGAAPLPVLAILDAYLTCAGTPRAAVAGWLATDPIGRLAETGQLPASLDTAFDDLALATRWAASHIPRLATMAVDAGIYHDAGANAVQELTFALATAVALMRALGERGLDPAVIAPRLQFSFAIGPQFFVEVAKLRAARVLCANVLEAFGLPPAQQRATIHARTGRLNQTLTDLNVNMLRATTEALAAVAAGVDSLHIGAYDAVAGHSTRLARRVARNVHAILREEANLFRFIDPAGGAWAVESLTATLAEKAWTLFQQIEALGGMLPALRDGLVREQLATTMAGRQSRLATRQDALVGTNRYAAADEELPSYDSSRHNSMVRARLAGFAAQRVQRDEAAVLNALAGVRRLREDASGELVDAMSSAAAVGATIGELTASTRRDEPPFTVTPVTPWRLSEPFEALRRRAAALEAATGARPKIILANMGPPRQHRARAEFSQGFFAVGGFEVASPPGFDATNDAAAALLASGAGAFVICSTDETYPALVPPLVAAVKREAPGIAAILAGRPREQVSALQDAGIDAFIYLGADCLAANSWLLHWFETQEAIA